MLLNPVAAYIAFDENSLFRDTWLVGGYAGLDFNKYIGVRGFYFQAVESMELSTDFDNLSIYGMEFRARLNASTGITPYISLGGGYINPQNNYRGSNELFVEGNEFATGGLGLNIPLGKRVLITGGARAMITSAANAEDIQAPGDLQTHLMYNAGIKFTLGRKAKSTDAIYQENLSQDVESRMAENDQKIQQMKKDYQENIAELEMELKNATDEKDVDKAVDIMKEKDKAQKALNEVEKLEKVHKETYDGKMQNNASNVTSNRIQMSPAEFESLVVNILKETQQEKGVEAAPKTGVSSEDANDLKQQIDAINKRLDFLEKLLIEINAQKGSGTQIINPKSGELDATARNAELSREILDEIDDLNKKIERISSQVASDGKQAQTIVVTPAEQPKADTYITMRDDEGKVTSQQTVTTTNQKLFYKHSAAMLGLNVGGATTTNLGVRLFYDIVNLPIQFMPEIYIGVGSTTSFGFSGNVIYPFTIKSDKVIPYAGLGLGLARIDREFRGNYNVILGTQLTFIDKNLSIDYTMRNSFDYNQLALTYKLTF